MADINDPASDKPEAEATSTDWAGLRAQAAKLGISLSELQQREREKKLRLARKSQPRVNAPVTTEALPEP